MNECFIVSIKYMEILIDVIGCIKFKANELLLKCIFYSSVVIF